MAKLMTYIIITFGIMALLNLAGLNTSGNFFLTELGIRFDNIENFDGAQFYTILFVAIGSLVLVSGITTSFISTPTQSTAIAAVAALPLALLTTDIIWIIQSSGSGWSGYLVYLIMVPFMIGYMIALFDWVRSGGES